MMAPRATVQRVIGFDGLKCAAEFHPQSMPLGFANTTSNSSVHPVEQPDFATTQLKEVAKEGERRSRIGTQPLAATSSTFEIPPLSSSAVANGKFIKQPQVAAIDGERWTKIRERERHSSTSGQRARYLHRRQQLFQSAAGKPAEIGRPMPVSVTKHTCPGRGVKERSSVIARQQCIPFGMI